MPTVNELVQRKGYDGPYVGIEIEVEGSRLPLEVKGWRCERDGSLRGESMEYVLPVPLLVDGAELSLKQLNLAFLKNKAVVEDTGYAGIHVHVNVGDMTPKQLVRYALAYYTIEELALRWCGEDRVGNLFCLGIRAANLPLTHFKTAIERADLRHVHNDDIRYAALNFKALAEYGSFEFRSMRSTLDRAVILAWVNMLLELRAFALEDRPLDWILSHVSQQGRDILKTLLPTSYKMFYDMDGAEETLRDGVRAIQMFIATFDEEAMNKYWEHRAKGAEKVDPKREPFRKVFEEMGIDERERAVAGFPGRPLPKPFRDIQIVNEPEEDI